MLASVQHLIGITYYQPAGQLAEAWIEAGGCTVQWGAAPRGWSGGAGPPEPGWSTQAEYLDEEWLRPALWHKASYYEWERGYEGGLRITIPGWIPAVVLTMPVALLAHRAFRRRRARVARGFDMVPAVGEQAASA
jgi:hypothetical protein